jgi:UDP-GlcNAc:undecaprenyl-phosphate GlcNAc-1-phosphate transferase
MTYSSSLMDHIFWLGLAAICAAGCALVLSRLRVSVKNGLEGALTASQSSHLVPTSRLGGVAILVGVLVAILMGYRDNSPWLMVGIVPVFLIGLCEDLGFNLRPLYRLVVMSLSCLIVVGQTGVVLTSIDVIGIDYLFEFSGFAVTFTVFAVVGLTNGINLIDGVNGLASSKVIFAFSALSVVAFRHGDVALFQAALIIAAATLGVFVVNFPFGKIFMGDAGAYSLGFILAWMVVLLNERHPDISAWSLLCIISWPIFDTVFAIVRRLRAGRAADKPDHLHFHQLVMRAWELVSRGKMHRSVSNPLATVTIWPLTLPTIVLGAMYAESVAIGTAVFFASGFAFWGSYVGAMYVLRRRQLRAKLGVILRGLYDISLGRVLGH